MKTQKLIIISLLAFVLSCKKENDKTSSCLITSLIQAGTNGNQVFNLTYNDEGKVATIDQVSGLATHKDFSYQGNTIYVISLDKDGHFTQKDSITIDDKGRPLNIRQFMTADGSVYTNIIFEYNGDDLVKHVQTSYPGSSTSTTTFTYQNGNPVTLSSGNASSILDFYTDKKLQKGDYLEVASLIQYGISIYPHKNLVKMIASGGSITNLVYEYNSDGLISKLTATSGNDITLLNYGYECR
jgi:hypothetical protein